MTIFKSIETFYERPIQFLIPEADIFFSFIFKLVICPITFVESGSKTLSCFAQTGIEDSELTIERNWLWKFNSKR